MMIHLRNTCLVFCSMAIVWLPNESQAQSPSIENAKVFLSNYCVACRTVDDPSGEREFESLNLGKVDWDTQRTLQEIVDQITLGAMPPEDAD